MKKSLFKTLTIIICMLTIFNFVLPNITTIVYAETEAQKQESEVVAGHETFFGAIADGFVGLLTWPLRVLIVVLGEAIRLVIGGVASISGGQFNPNISPEDILFNRLQITDINFFDFNSGLSDGVLTIRQNVAIWFMALRNLAVGILLAILVYVGIRMAMSTIAEEQARYKTMLKDWLISFVLVFLMQYIIAFTINFNNTLVSILENALNNSTQNNIFSNVMDTLFVQGLQPASFTMGIGSAIAFCILVGVTLSFLVFYIKRMLTLAFLIIISPIITITYSIDKMGDNQSQALNAWLKEFVYTVLIQPFQCLIFIVFATTAINLMQDMTLGAAILGCIMILFIHQAEDIVREIFSFQHAHHLGNTFLNLAIISKLSENLKKAGNAASKNNANVPISPKAAGSAPTQAGTQGPRSTNQAQNNANATNGSASSTAGTSRPRGTTASGATAANAASTTDNADISKGYAQGGKKPSVFNRAKANAARLANTKVGKILGAQARIGTGIALTAMGAGANGVEGAGYGLAAGQGISNLSGAKWHNAANRQAVSDANQAQLAQAYNAYVQQQRNNGIMVDGVLMNGAIGRDSYNSVAREVLLGRDINTFDQEDQQLAQVLAQTKAQYEQMGFSQAQIAKEFDSAILPIQKNTVDSQFGQEYGNFIQQQGNVTAAKIRYAHIRDDVLNNNRNVNTFSGNDKALAQSLVEYRDTYQQMGYNTEEIINQMDSSAEQIENNARKAQQTRGGTPTPTPTSGSGSGTPPPTPSSGSGNGGNSSSNSGSGSGTN